ncbi:unnamed protein product [Ilex paraguariensis]|uniref:CLAVATA3/ESR (CLE)-related protein 46 n=1 Tax=Ilex paraguariensis TaxID=185542 RepID=A0ABC8R4K5_9AQUA
MRTKTLVHFLILWLLLATSQHHYTIASKNQAMESVDFKIKRAQYSSRSTTGRILTPWVKEQKNRKKPSGPNPVGNYRPPTKP